MPEKSQALWVQLGYQGSPGDIDPASLVWGEGSTRDIGTLCGLFPRINGGKLLQKLGLSKDVEKGPQKPKSKNQSQKKKAPQPPSASYKPGEGADAILDYTTFLQSDIRVGKILEAKSHPKADRLIVLSVDVGEDSPRQICAGIAPHYQPSELEGVRVLVVANLTPRKLRGLVSQGMILAASEGEDGQPYLVEAPEGVPPGGRVR